MNEILKNGLTLVIILVVSLSLLSFVNSLTEPVIKQNAIEKERKAELSIFPEATSFEDNGEYIEVYTNSQIVGYLVQGSEYGYSSEVTVLVGFNVDKTIKAAVVLDQQETPGLGARVIENSFINQFKSISIEKVSLKKYGGQIDGVTGATKSSRAFTDAIKDAYQKLP